MSINTTSLPTLFKKTSTGAINRWHISTIDNVITTRWGQLDGAEQRTEDVILAGKNQGKANQTTPTEQAQKEATARWEKQLKSKKYVQSIEEAEAGARDSRVQGGIDVMLAHRFDQHGDKITYPCYAQPKLDGHRCIAVVKEGKCTLWSRTRKPITGVPHINRAVEEAVQIAYGDNEYLMLDGELYSHHYREKFEELTSFIRQVTPKAGHEVVEYHVYDTPSCEAGYSYRLNSLVKFFAVCPSGPLRFVETAQIGGEDELLLAFERFRAQGYEGAMARNAWSSYVGKRSKDLQKIKEFLDAEFKVVRLEEGRGKLAGHAIFVCVTADGQEFSAKMRGETAELKRYFDCPDLAIGRLLTVKYQGLTKNGIPRFPVGERLRDDL